MFLGRETYARELAQKLETLELIENEDTIYPIIKKLKNSGIINEIEKLEKQPGIPHIRTSTFIPFFTLLKIVRPSVTKEELERIKEYIHGAGNAVQFFPDFLRMVWDISNTSIQKLKWPLIAGTYLNFLLGLLIFINPVDEFDAKAYSQVTNELLNKELGNNYFNPMRKALGKTPKDLYDDISNEHYQDDMLLLAELSGRILYGPTYESMKNTIGYAAITKLAAYYKNGQK